ncbi:MAG: nucleotidyltransferase domain-containing protein [Bacteroidia bacterium]
MKRKTEIITKLIRKKVSEIDPQAQVILFGSRARGDERIDSDWDVLILTEYSIDIEKENQFRNHLYDIELETGEPISLFAYSKADWNTKQRISPFYANVRKEGISL